MAHYDTGHHFLPGVTSVTIKIVTFNTRILSILIKKLQEIKIYRLVGNNFYVKTLESAEISPGLRKTIATLISNGECALTNIKIEKLKRKFDNFSITVESNPIEFNTIPGWVHDFFKIFCIDKKERIYIAVKDFLPDSHSLENKESLYPFETEKYKEVEYWCSDCNDTHIRNEVLETKRFSTKRKGLLYAKKQLRKTNVNNKTN